MDQFLYTLLIVFGFVLVSFVLINIRQILTGREFRGTCASNNPMIKDSMGECSVCGSRPGENCRKDEAAPSIQ